MKYLVLIATTFVTQLARSQDTCKLFIAISEMVAKRNHKFAFVNDAWPEKYSHFPYFILPVGMTLDSSLKEEIVSAANSIPDNSVLIISSCSANLPTIQSSQIDSSFKSNRIIRTSVDTPEAIVIHQRMNAILTIQNEKKQLRALNAYMTSQEYVNHEHKIADSITVLIRISRPVIYSNFAIVAVVLNVYGGFWDTYYYALFEWKNDKWVLVATAND